MTAIFVLYQSDKDLSGTVKKDREAAEKEEEIDEAVEDDDVQKIESPRRHRCR